MPSSAAAALISSSSMPHQVIYQDIEREALTPVEKEENKKEYIKAISLQDWLKQGMAVETQDQNNIRGGLTKRSRTGVLLSPRDRRAPLRLSLANNLDVLRQRLISNMERKKTNQDFAFVQTTTARTMLPPMESSHRYNRQRSVYKPPAAKSRYGTANKMKYRPPWRSNQIRNNIWSNFLQATSSFPRHIREIGK
jgi:hypothetical protein